MVSAIILFSVSIFAFGQSSNFSGFYYPRLIGIDSINQLLYVVEAFPVDDNVLVFDIDPKVAEPDGSPSLLRTLKTGRQGPHKIVVDPSSGKVYVIQLLDRAIEVYDGKNVRQGKGVEYVFDVPAEQKTGVTLLDIIPFGDGEHVWFIQYGANPKIILADSSGVSQKEIPLTSSPFRSAYDSIEKKLYISYGSGSSHLTVVDTDGVQSDMTISQGASLLIWNTDTGLVTVNGFSGDISFIGNETKTYRLPFPAHFLVPGREGIVYVGNQFEKDIIRVSKTGAIERMPIGVLPIEITVVGQWVAVLGHNGVVAYFEEGKKDNIRYVDTLSRHSVGGPYQYFSIMAGDTKNDRLFVLNEDNDAVTGIQFTDASHFAIQKLPDISGLEIYHPVGVAFWGDKIFVANFFGTISVFNRKTGETIGIISTKSLLDDIRVVNNTVLAASGSEGKLFVIDASMNQIKNTVSLYDSSSMQERPGPLAFQNILGEGRENTLALADLYGERWILLDVSNDIPSVLMTSEQKGLLRAPIVTKDAMIINADYTTGSVEFSFENSASGARTIKLENGFTPLYYSLDSTTSDIIVTARSLSGEAYIFVFNAKGIMQSKFSIGSAVEWKVVRRTGLNSAEGNPVWFSFFNNYTNTIWVFTGDSVAEYTKSGEYKKSFLHNLNRLITIPFVDGTTMYIVGRDSISAIDLVTEQVTILWNFYRDGTQSGIRTAPAITRITAAHNAGVAVLNGYDAVNYRNVEDGTWRVLTNKNKNYVPAFLTSRMTEEQKTKSKKNITLFTLIGAALVVVALFIYEKMKKNKMPVQVKNDL